MTLPAGGDRHIRWQVAFAFGVLTATFTLVRVLHEPNWTTDVDQLWHAAAALRGGGDPYAAVGPDRPFRWDWPLVYPLPAVLVTLPLTLVPVAAARVVFSAIAAAVLGWATGPRVRTHWPMLLSASFIIAASRTQWAPLLLAAAWVPGLALFVAAKPNVGLAALAALPRKALAVALAGPVVLTATAFLIQPGWVIAWRDAIRYAPHIQPAVQVLPFGPLLLLAAARWRRPDARLLLVLALVPHTPSLYDLLLLFFACRTLRESLVLGVLTHVLYWGIVFAGPFGTFNEYAATLGRLAVISVYLPVLVAVLLRPNETDGATVPDRLATVAWLPTLGSDRILTVLLLGGATMLVWLPLVTYR